MEFVKFDRVFLKTHPEFNEKWVQERIAEDPKILGLGDLILKDKERIQPKAGRLDILLQDTDSSRRYEVEIQLGATDESHIIRTIEYWDIERKRYPQYDHIAVIIAEDITSRFLNVISLFNGQIPLIAIQMKALKYENKISLDFTTVLDQLSFGLDDEDEPELTDRAYWESKASKKTVVIADEILKLVKQQLDDSLELKYNKVYIGLAKSGLPNNFITITPKREFCILAPRLIFSSEKSEQLENNGLDMLGYNNPKGRYQIRLKPDDIEKNREILSEVLNEAYKTSKN